MLHELAAAQAAEWLGKLETLRDQDELPSEVPWGRLAAECPAAISQLLAALGKKKLGGAFRKEYRKSAANKNLKALPRLRSALKLDPKGLAGLPPQSFLLQFQFTLEQPMMTRDDELFTVSDNAVRKDRALGWPHLAGSSWKGAFRAALYLQEYRWEKNENPECLRLLGRWNEGGGDEGAAGPEEDSEQDLHRGRLKFFSSVFEKIDFRMLNPQDRVTRAGKIPIELEVVPPGEKSWFQLLYVPAWGPRGVEPAVEHAAADWIVVARGVKGMLREYGFGAKVSLGFGLARSAVEGGLLAIVTNDGLLERKFQKIDDLMTLAPEDLWK